MNMGLKDKMVEKLVDRSVADLSKVLESIHAHLEIQTRELIKMRRLTLGITLKEEEVDGIIKDYQKIL